MSIEIDYTDINCPPAFDVKQAVSRAKLALEAGDIGSAIRELCEAISRLATEADDVRGDLEDAKSNLGL